MKKEKIAKIVNTHGLKGQLKFLPLVDDQGVFKNLKKFEIAGFGQVECEKISKNGNVYSTKLVGFDDINQVEFLKGKDVFVELDEIKLNKNQFFIEDLIGSKIVFEEKEIGEILSVENYGASDVLTFVDNDKKQKCVPFVADFFDIIDAKNKILVANLHFFEGVV